MFSTRPAPRSAPSAGAAKRRKVTRPPQPRVPEDFFSPEAHAFLSNLLARRAKSWKEDWLKPVYFHGRDSEPLWDECATRRVSGTTLHIASRCVLVQGMSMDLERVLRLLTLPWMDETHTADGHTSDEWRAGLTGALWRIGQHYREFARRRGPAQAQDILRQTIEALWI